MDLNPFNHNMRKNLGKILLAYHNSCGSPHPVVCRVEGDAQSRMFEQWDIEDAVSNNSRVLHLYSRNRCKLFERGYFVQEIHDLNPFSSQHSVIPYIKLICEGIVHFEFSLYPTRKN